MKLLALCLLSAAAWAAPCTIVTNCTEWVTFAGGPARSLVYRTYPLDSTIVIAPHLASSAGTCRDQLAPNEVSWSCAGDSWRSGGTATNYEKLTSFDFTDEILRKLAKKDIFPNLKAIVVSGHSAGGQYVDRYAMANTVHDNLGVPVTYVVSNPSSYAYLDNTRPNPDGM